jgi:hypothetical protein
LVSMMISESLSARSLLSLVISVGQILRRYRHLFNTEQDREGRSNYILRGGMFGNACATLDYARFRDGMLMFALGHNTVAHNKSISCACITSDKICCCGVVSNTPGPRRERIFNK